MKKIVLFYSRNFFVVKCYGSKEVYLFNFQMIVHKKNLFFIMMEKEKVSIAKVFFLKTNARCDSTIIQVVLIAVFF